MNRRRWILIVLILGGLGVAFLAVPVVIGYNEIGGRDGPAFYPRGIHESLYIIGHEAATGEKPRVSLTWSLYDRPRFWGLPRRPKSDEERNRFLRKLADRSSGTESTFYQMLFAENERINNGQHGEVF